MRSYRTKSFHKAFARLPQAVQQQAKTTYHQFAQDPYHPSLHFKRVIDNPPTYSIRININYRALGVRNPDQIVWFWIGPHDDYEKLISQ